MIRVLPSKLLKARTKEKMGLQVLNEKFYAASVLKVMGSLTWIEGSKRVSSLPKINIAWIPGFFKI